MQYTKKNFVTPESFPADLLVEGTFIARQKEHRNWVKDGVQKEMDLVCLFVQAPSGSVFVCRSFNPPYDFSDFKAGEKICIPVNEYKVENGVRTVFFRLN